jgi:hypothetical protein
MPTLFILRDAVLDMSPQFSQLHFRRQTCVYRIFPANLAFASATEVCKRYAVSTTAFSF